MSELLRKTFASKRSPSGLVLPVHATLRGRVRWQVLDERGVPEVPRDPSGRALGPAEGIEQSNLITNYGMDEIGTRQVLQNQGSADHIRKYLALGTGSTAPDFTDVALVNEVETRSLSSGGFADSSDVGIDTVNNVFWYDLIAVRVITMTANRNLTEFGLSHAVSGSNISIRELLRDGVGTPVTVSLLSGKTLRFDHTLRVEIPCPAAGTAGSLDIVKYDIGGVLESTTAYTVTHGPAMRDGWQPYVVPFLIWEPWRGFPNEGSSSFVRLISAWAYDRLAMDFSKANEITSPTLVAYVPGSYEREKFGVVGAAVNVGDWYGYGVSRQIGALAGNIGYWMCVFDSPVSYTKLNTDSIRVAMMSSWSRA